MKVLKADGKLHRRCEGIVEHVSPLGWVIATEPGVQVFGETGPVWTLDGYARNFFVSELELNLVEIYNADRTPRQLYINVISPVIAKPAALICTDHELDIMDSLDGTEPVILDEDEFSSAIAEYGYIESLVETCRSAARGGIEIAKAWDFGCGPEQGLRHLARYRGAFA